MVEKEKQEALSQEQKIQMIKIVREISGLSLKDSKYFVDHIQEYMQPSILSNEAIIWAEKTSYIQMKGNIQLVEFRSGLNYIPSDYHLSIFHENGTATALFRIVSDTKVLWQRITNPYEFKENNPFMYLLLCKNANEVYKENNPTMFRINELSIADKKDNSLIATEFRKIIPFQQTPQERLEEINRALWAIVDISENPQSFKVDAETINMMKSIYEQEKKEIENLITFIDSPVNKIN